MTTINRSTPPPTSASASRLRSIIVGLGDSGSEAARILYERLPAGRKTFILANTHIKASELSPELMPQGTVLPMPIPAWPTETPSPTQFDDHAAERSFLHHGRAYPASVQGAEGRYEGAIACIDCRADFSRALEDAVSRVGRLDSSGASTVLMVICQFAGRGTGSGGLPVVIGMLEPLRAAFAGQVNLVITIAAQLPTVRVEDLQLYRTRSAALLAEITGLREERLATDPDRSTGGWVDRLPWNDFLLFGAGAGRTVQPRGVVTDLTESTRFMAAVLYERLAGEAAEVLAAESPNRASITMHRDDGTGLGRMFGATGIAELVYEPAAAVEHGAAFLERALYDAVRIARKERT